MNSLVIMAGGASSRMKKSLEQTSLDATTKAIAQRVHKSLIPLGVSQKPLLVHLLENAQAAGYEKIYLITAPENSTFKTVLSAYPSLFSNGNFQVHYAFQYPPTGHSKPLGTADAVLQAMTQYPELEKNAFTLCNGDNLYSKKSLALLLKPHNAPHSLISYDRSGLHFSEERIARFAILALDSESYLTEIIEKPTSEQLAQFRDEKEKVYVSMNLFRFTGKLLKPYLEKCPIHPERKEKELPVAVGQLVQQQPKTIYGHKLTENVPDLTAATDLYHFT